jgi:PhnB protein
MNSFFAPQLFLKNVAAGVAFYQKAYGVKVLRQWDNPDGSIHVAELELDGALFHLHEDVPRVKQISPSGSISVLIGLFVDDVHAVVESAVAAGATILEPVQDYDYGYRQATILDPFGHQWMIEKKI